MSMKNFSKPLTNKKLPGRPSSNNKETTDFSKVGGLSHHINTLKDLIIFPLLHGNVYAHFKIKAPRGVLFYGPPGTGKTLVAGALATEMSKDSSAKVSFFQRKGADVLDKWVGESEKKLRDLFDKASRNRPAVIFFDELDGLAPVRSEKNDHVHCSVVATLLALMDGLDSMPGVIIIGATNRLESVDPALRRPGRFDKELYFPLPATDARKEILQVHTQSWKYKPSSEFLGHLAEITVGFCGSDLQALCADAVLCCVKRLYPNIQKSMSSSKTNINLDSMKVEECDFLNARQSMVSSSLKLGSKRRKLSNIVRPLLDRQVSKVLSHIRLVWPHFLMKGYKYLIGSERYAGRIILFGSNKQGLNTHLVPAILQSLEHLPGYVLDIPTIFDRNINNVTRNLPSVLVLSRIDDWWDLIESSGQISLAAALEEIHAGLPILVIATCKDEVPQQLHDFFYGNCSIVINIDDPSSDERAEFLAPIFFSEKQHSVNKVLTHLRNARPSLTEIGARGEARDPLRASIQSQLRMRKKTKHVARLRGGGHGYEELFRLHAGGRIKRRPSSHKSKHSVFRDKSRLFKRPTSSGQANNSNASMSCCSMCEKLERMEYFAKVLSELIGRRALINNFACDKPIKTEPRSATSILKCSGLTHTGDATDSEKARIYSLWKRSYQQTSRNMTVSELELLYDAISTCINMYGFSFKALCEHLEHILDKFGSDNN